MSSKPREQENETQASRADSRAFSSISFRVGEGFYADQPAACANSATPEIWFSDEPSRGNGKNDYVIKSAMVAMRTCNECPMRQACLNYAMTDGDAFKYGIWGGTFAFERAGVKKPGGNNKNWRFQRQLRKKLITEEGLTCPPIPQQASPNTSKNYTRSRRKRVKTLSEQGLTAPEIAKELGVPTTTIRQDKHKNRKA